jgi:hypothetical protein
MNEKTVLPFLGPNHSEFTHSLLVRGKYDPSENLGSIWLRITFFLPPRIGYQNLWCAKGSAEQFGDSNELTGSKTFSALASQRERATLLCVSNEERKQKENSLLLQEV